MSRKLQLFIFTVFMLAAGSVRGATIWVPDDHATIQLAINAAADLDTILVRPGTYVENIDFLGKIILIQSEQGAQVTTIDGNQAGYVVSCTSGEIWPTTLDGFTITNALDAGIYCANSALYITNNIITGNSSGNGRGIDCTASAISRISACTISGNGGTGAYFHDGASCRIEYSTISDNGYYGIDVSAADQTYVTDNVITANQLTGVRCMYNSVEIIDNVVSNNLNDGIMVCLDSGGGPYLTAAINGNIVQGNLDRGIYCYGEPNATIAGNNVTGNTGGGIYCDNPGARIEKNLVIRNSGQWGAGIKVEDSPKVVNNIIAGNSATKNGGGIYCGYLSTATITNNTVTDNFAAQYGGGLCCANDCDVTVANTILWNNDAPAGPEAAIIDSMSGGSILTVSYSDLEGGSSSVHVDPQSLLNWGTGMIDADPDFIEPVVDDFHITLFSPCCGTGDSAAPSLPVEDFEGDPRISSLVEIGADEVCTHLYHTGAVVPGGNIDIRVIGPAFSSPPVTLGLGSGIQDPPQATPFGDLYLDWPIQQFNLGNLSISGVLIFPATLPLTWQPGEEYPFQALVGPFSPGSSLTNLMVLTVE